MGTAVVIDDNLLARLGGTEPELREIPRRRHGPKQEA
jgi:hypothetical protein